MVNNNNDEAPNTGPNQSKNCGFVSKQLSQAAQHNFTPWGLEVRSTRELAHNDHARRSAVYITEDNIIADGISRVERSANADSYFRSLIQDYPQLRSCRRFQPSAELVSSVIRILLQDHSVEPLTLSRQILGQLGRSTT